MEEFFNEELLEFLKKNYKEKGNSEPFISPFSILYNYILFIFNY